MTRSVGISLMRRIQFRSMWRELMRVVMQLHQYLVGKLPEKSTSEIIFLTRCLLLPVANWELSKESTLAAKRCAYSKNCTKSRANCLQPDFLVEYLSTEEKSQFQITHNLTFFDTAQGLHIAKTARSILKKNHVRSVVEHRKSLDRRGGCGTNLGVE